MLAYRDANFEVQQMEESDVSRNNMHTFSCHECLPGP